MKTYKMAYPLLIIYMTVMIAAITIVACSSHSVSVEDQQMQKLQGTWKASSVQVDGTDITDQYTDFTITFFKSGSTKEMVATNPGYAFYAGTDVWDFAASSKATKIIRSSDGIEMNVQVTQSNLTLTFNVPVTSAGGRVSGMSGNFTFNLVRK
jgi:hypothetical protein